MSRGASLPSGRIKAGFAENAKITFALRGAQAEPSPDGARLVFEATGRQLAAWIEAAGKSEIEDRKSEMQLDHSNRPWQGQTMMA
jgi:hypothetical protein